MQNFERFNRGWRIWVLCMKLRRDCRVPIVLFPPPRNRPPTPLVILHWPISAAPSTTSKSTRLSRSAVYAPHSGTQVGVRPCSSGVPNMNIPLFTTIQERFKSDIPDFALDDYSCWVHQSSTWHYLIHMGSMT